VRGDGFVFQRGSRWWIGYNRDGTLYREPAGTSKGQAKARLRQVHKAAASGTLLTPQERRITVAGLLDDLLTHLENKGLRSARKSASHMRAVRDELGHLRAADLSTADVERYQATRLKAKRMPATVNRECELLRQAYRRAFTVTPKTVSEVPSIPLLTIENTRQGFVSPAEFKALAASISNPDVRDYLEFFWWTGMRPGEIRQLTWKMVDLRDMTLSLDPRAAKTGKGRVIALEGPLQTIIERRRKARRLDCPLVFHRVSKGQPGQPIKDYIKLWRAALKAAKLAPGLLPYDLRRSAVRNLIRAGVHETVAMKISGHRTRATFDRYNIAAVEDLREAVRKVAAYAKAQPKRNVSAIEDSQKTHNSRGR